MEAWRPHPAQLKKQETSMDLDEQARPSDLAEQQASNRLVQLIRKLRWINMDDEAEHGYRRN
jgi:hypothetical protein